MTDQHIDPRPDLTADASAWECLLATQYVRDGNAQDGLYGTLLGFRAEGAQLVLEDERLRIEPGELGADYPLLRSVWLVPRRKELTALLATVADKLNQERNVA